MAKKTVKKSRKPKLKLHKAPQDPKSAPPVAIGGRVILVATDGANTRIITQTVSALELESIARKLLDVAIQQQQAAIQAGQPQAPAAAEPAKAVEPDAPPLPDKVAKA